MPTAHDVACWGWHTAVPTSDLEATVLEKSYVQSPFSPKTTSFELELRQD